MNNLKNDFLIPIFFLRNQTYCEYSRILNNKLIINGIFSVHQHKTCLKMLKYLNKFQEFIFN